MILLSVKFHRSPGVVVRCHLARTLGYGELEEPRDVVENRVEHDRDDELPGLDVVPLDEEGRPDSQEPLHGDGHSCVARPSQAYLEETTNVVMCFGFGTNSTANVQSQLIQKLN